MLQFALRGSTVSERERRVGRNIFITVYNGRRANWHTSQSLNHPLMKTQRVSSDPNKNPRERRERITNKANQVPRLHIQLCTERQQKPPPPFAWNCSKLHPNPPHTPTLSVVVATAGLFVCF